MLQQFLPTAGATSSVSTAATDWVPAAGPADEPVRLFALPYAGGGASLYRGWAAALPGVAVSAVHLPGREGRLAETPYDRIDPLVTALADAIDGLLDRPYAVFGHSMGARIAFELTRELRRRHRPGPFALIVSCCKAPHIPRIPKPPVGSLSPALFLQVLRRMNGTPPEILDDPDLLAALLPALRADFTLIDEYDYDDEYALDCPIRAFGGVEDSDAREDDLLAWQSHTTASFRLRMLRGGHFVVRSRQREMLAAIAADLADLAD